MGHFIISDDEVRRNKEADVRTYLIIKLVERKRLFRSPVYETLVVGKTRASNWGWAMVHVMRLVAEEGLEYDYIVEAKKIIE